MMFVMLLWVCIHTGQAEKLAWPRWESNQRPLGHQSNALPTELRGQVGSSWWYFGTESSSFDISVFYDMIINTLISKELDSVPKSYLIRTTRVWNTLPRDLVTINGMATLKEFKNKLYIYYKTALDKCYDVDDPRTWKTV